MREKKMLNPRFFYSLLVFHLLLLKCDHCDAVKDLKETHLSDEEGKGSMFSSSSYIKSLEKKYQPGYILDDVKGPPKSSYIARLESKYQPSYGLDESESKSSSPSSSYIKRLEKKYQPGYILDDVKGSSESSYIARLESKYQPSYGVDESEPKSSSPSSSYIKRLEKKYQPGYILDDVKGSSESSYIARLESKYQPSYGLDESESKSSSPSSSYINRLEKKYQPGYILDDVKGPPESSYIARLESKYQPSYGLDESESKSSSPSSSYIKRIEKKYQPGYILDDVKGPTESSYIARLESKYQPSYGLDESESKSSSPSSSYIKRLEKKYQPGYILDDVKSPPESSYIARLESKYQPSYGLDESESKSSSPSSSYIKRFEKKYQPGYILDDVKGPPESSYIARLENKYQPSYGLDESEPKNSFPSSSYIKRLEKKYQPGYILDDVKDPPESSYIARLESIYKPVYVLVDEVEENSSPSSRITRLESKYQPDYGVIEAEKESSSDYGVYKDGDTNSSPSRMVHQIVENNEDDDIGSEDVGVFTIDDIRAFKVGRKLSTFFSIRNHSLYPGFLPKEVADSFPFSSSEVPKILQFFSISPLSPKGKAVKDTARKCEIEPAKGETKICATSSESMLEFVRNAFGPGVDFELVSTSHPTMTTPILQSYTIMEPPREIESPKKVACHPMPYLYAIYMCHYDAFETKIFKVALAGENGDKVDALIVCHMDTSTWSPKHMAFSLLGTKPGIPVCHAFSEGHGVWIQSSTATAI